jgi:hypothetical protein
VSGFEGGGGGGGFESSGYEGGSGFDGAAAGYEGSGQEALDAAYAQAAIEQQGQENAMMLLDPVGTTCEFILFLVPALSPWFGDGRVCCADLGNRYVGERGGDAGCHGFDLEQACMLDWILGGLEK